MSDTVISVENLGKKYILSHLADKRERLFSSLLVNKIKNAGSRTRGLFSSSGIGGGEQTSEEFWALKDVSFQIRQGDRVGIIGRNGAGKSTLLKILSRITEPTRGRITIDGRVASLLEVGTGFHSELSGRENIFLNGAILGMSREEIRRKFDEIVAFAEVERFLDTPVKRYSSGMYVRLAFAVAAHMEPEILIVDEVLAVGDAQFQKKCLGKMEDVSAKEGRTVLFVSHNMGSIMALCNKGILLSAGEVAYQGGISDAVSLYNGALINSGISVENCSRRGGSGGIAIRRIWIADSQGERVNSFTGSEPVSLNLEAEVAAEYRDHKRIVVGIGIDNLEGQRLVTCVSSWAGTDLETHGPLLKVACHLPSLPFVIGKYFVSASISYLNDTLDYVEHCEYFEIVQRDVSFLRGRDAGHGYLEIPYTFEAADVH